MQLHHDCLPDGTALLRLAGELTIYHAAELQCALLPLAAEARTLTLDLSGVSDVDSAGIQLLVATRRTLAGNGAALRLHARSDAVGEALALVGMADAFAVTAPD